MENVLINKSIPTVAKADVVVVGGGLGGVSAALAAARAGANVILTETNGFLGGVATAGMCCSVFNCMFSRDRRLMIGGNPIEIVDTLATCAGPGSSWKNHKGHIIYDVERAKLVLAELLEKAGVHILINTPVCDVIKASDKVSHVVVCGKNGLEAISCKTLVDATGDCNALALAGAELKNAEQHRASYVFRLGKVDVDRFVKYLCDNPDEYPGRMDIDWSLEEAVAQYKENGTFLFPHGGGMQMSAIKKATENGDLPVTFGKYDTLDAMQMHMIRDKGVCHVITGYVSNPGLDARDMTAAVNDGKRIAFIFCEMMQKYMPGFENAYVSQCADDLGIRGSRCIVGEKSFTKVMKESAYRCSDAIGVGVVETYEYLNDSDKAWGTQVFGNDVWEIPLGCLIPKGVDNMIVGAGRGADTEPPLLLRVMVNTMAVGQGAGVAAALSAKMGVKINALDLDVLKNELIRQGVKLSNDN